MSQTTCFQPKRGYCAAAVAAAIAAVLAGLVAAGDGDVGHGFADYFRSSIDHMQNVGRSNWTIVQLNNERESVSVLKKRQSSKQEKKESST